MIPLHFKIPSHQGNANSKRWIEMIKRYVCDNLKMCLHALCILKFDIPKDALPPEDERTQKEPDPVVRISQDRTAESVRIKLQ